MNEIWKDIKNYEELYQVSNKGRVKSLNKLVTDISGRVFEYKEKFLSTKSWIKNKRPYYSSVTLFKNKQKKNFGVHRLVAEAFIPNPSGKLEVNHKDQNRDNNSIDNLEWVTRKENLKHIKYLGQKGSSNGNSKLTENDIKNICKLINNKYSNSDIKKELNLLINNTTLQDIRYKRKWKHLTSVKELPDIIPKNSTKLSALQVEKICNLLKDGKYTNPEIIKLLNLNVGVRLISKIKNKQRWKHLKCVQDL